MEVNYLFIRIISIVTFIYIIRLIHIHKLRIGLTWFLFLLGLGLLILSVWPNAINAVGLITGSASWLSNVLFFLIIFLFIIIVHCTVMISGLTSRVKELGQELALLSSEIDDEKIKREAGMAHSIKAVTVHPVVVDELRSMALNPSDNVNCEYPLDESMTEKDNACQGDTGNVDDHSIGSKHIKSISNKSR